MGRRGVQGVGDSVDHGLLKGGGQYSATERPHKGGLEGSKKMGTESCMWIAHGMAPTK